jgi:uncharacterized RDD family membrane protein YckC
MNTTAPDPVTLVAGPQVAPSLYRCEGCWAIDTYPAVLPVGGVDCRYCGARISTTDVTRYASLAQRAMATTIDVMALVALTFPPFLLGGTIASAYVPRNADGRPTETAVFWFTLSVLVFVSLTTFVYATWGTVRGRTVGKRFMNLVVVRAESGRKTGVLRALLRTLALALTLGVSYAMVVIDRRRRALHDAFAGTIVVEQ